MIIANPHIRHAAVDTVIHVCAKSRLFIVKLRDA